MKIEKSDIKYNLVFRRPGHQTFIFTCHQVCYGRITFNACDGGYRTNLFMVDPLGGRREQGYFFHESIRVGKSQMLERVVKLIKSENQQRG